VKESKRERLDEFVFLDHQTLALNSERKDATNEIKQYKAILIWTDESTERYRH
jgi:hypothetical protein